MQTVNPIDKIKKKLKKLFPGMIPENWNSWHGALPTTYVRDVATLLCEIDRLQKENDRLKKELAAAV